MTSKLMDLTKSKEVEGKTYWWCERYKVWAIHKPEDCKPFEKSKNKDETKKSMSAKLVEATEALEEENSSNSE